MHRLLSVLKKRGYIEQVQESGPYRLGSGFVELASVFLNNIELKTEAEPHLRQLSQVTGQRRPVHCTALGKALVMHRAAGELEQTLRDSPFQRFAPHTHPDLPSLLRDLKASRGRGWTTDSEEYERNVHCLAAPIFDYRGSVVSFKKMAPPVVEAAHQISSRLGYTE